MVFLGTFLEKQSVGKRLNHLQVNFSNMAVIFHYIRVYLFVLLFRQRVVTDDMPLDCLISDYLPGEYRAELIPIARSGNKIETTRYPY